MNKTRNIRHWSMRRSFQQPSNLAYYIEDCWIFANLDLNWDCILHPRLRSLTSKPCSLWSTTITLFTKVKTDDINGEILQKRALIPSRLVGQTTLLSIQALHWANFLNYSTIQRWPVPSKSFFSSSSSRVWQAASALKNEDWCKHGKLQLQVSLTDFCICIFLPEIYK